MHLRASRLESNHSTFVAGVAHNARLVMSVRGLDTGMATDISGVLKIAKGCGWEEGAEDGRTLHEEGKEVLYFMGMDGGIKVWERRP